MYDDDEDDDLEMNAPGDELLYSPEELCQFAFEALERKHPIKITEIKYRYGGFDFSISADLTKQMTLPNCWVLRSFGDGVINFRLSLDDFQMLYDELEERAFMDAVRATLERMYEGVCDIVSIEEAEDPVFEGAVDVVLKLKPGCRFKNWLQVQWVEGDLVCIQIDPCQYDDLIQSDEYRNLFR